MTVPTFALAGTAGFTIAEPAITDRNSGYVSVAVMDPNQQGTFDCHVTNQFAGGFSFGCIPATGAQVGPPNGSELHYVVINLPSHISP
jgi:hypothetical protein